MPATGSPIERAPSEIIRDNILVTTTGVCSHASLTCALAALGEDSVMFSVDYPYEDCEVAAEFIDSAPISEAARAKVCHGTARQPVAACSAETQSGSADEGQARPSIPRRSPSPRG